MNCPRCGRHNPEDALFCLRCGQRLGGRASGVSYRSRDTGGGLGFGQTMLALLVVLLAGLVLAGGAFLVLFAGRPPLTPTTAGVVPTPTLTQLPTFEQPTSGPTSSPLVTPGPTVAPTASPTGSFFLPSPTPSPSLGTPPPTAEPTPGVTPRPTPRPTQRPTPQPTPRPTPATTPFNCESSTGTDLTSRVIGLGNPVARGPQAGRGWCLHRATFRIVSGSTFGVIRLFRGNRELALLNCRTVCPDPVAVPFNPPARVDPGQSLRYVFDCVGDDSTPETDECNDGTPDGGTIELFFETLPAP